MGATPGRYARQELFLGTEVQGRLQAATAVVVGCGALGCTAATILARAGVGRLRLIDRDYVDLVNLHRQILFDEEDVRAVLPKAVAAAAHLARANSTIAIEACFEDFTAGSAQHLCAGADVIVDALDNFEGRFLLNDLAVKLGVPWIYGAAVGSYGLAMAVLPGEGPCLRCLQEEEPPPGTTPTCDTAGIVASAPIIVASLQAAEALKLLGGRRDLVTRQLIAIDLWPGTVQAIAVKRHEACPCCGARRFEYLEGERRPPAISLCGRNAVQIAAPASGTIDLDVVAAQLGTTGEVTRNEYLVRAEIEGFQLTVFRDGRAIVVGTQDPAVARGLYARYVGA
ncbi:MAG: ThiF family adenylyltransferase [Deltaproteobacteria bacterium]|nr:ThiF family adenylyltransferase [Deltaproteobacteria bacterium]